MTEISQAMRRTGRRTHRALVAGQAEDQREDPRAVAVGAQLGLAALGAVLKSTGTDVDGTRSASECTVSSVSISNSRDTAGKLFTKRRENTR